MNGRHFDVFIADDLIAERTIASDEQKQKCLKAGAAHPLLEAAGHEKCWNCGFYLSDPFQVMAEELGYRLALTLNSVFMAP